MNNVTFEEIASSIISNSEFMKIDLESHHGITRYKHSMRVAKYVYKITKKLNLDYVSATRAAILHDFFKVDEFGDNRGMIQGVVHPGMSLSNAEVYFDLNDIERNGIEAHMFPLCTKLPKYKESWVITLVDKCVAVYEYSSYKFSIRKFNRAANLAAILVFYFITMGRR